LGTRDGPVASLADAAKQNDELFSTNVKGLDQISSATVRAGPVQETVDMDAFSFESTAPELKVDAAEKNDEVGPTLGGLKPASPKTSHPEETAARDDGAEAIVRLVRGEAARPLLRPRLPHTVGNHTSTAKPARLECEVELKKQDAPRVQPQPR